MDAKVRAKAKASTQDHIPIEDIIDDMVILRDASVAIILQTTAVNFDLLSTNEQDNKIYAFAGLLNSLVFPIQILVKTQRIDISSYLEYLKKQHKNTDNKDLQRQLTIYTKFVGNLIVQNDVLDKSFYVVIPYKKGSVMAGAKVKKKRDTHVVFTEKFKNRLIEEAHAYLIPKRDHILKQLGRMGLAGHQLNREEIIRVFYDIYNDNIEQYE